MIIDDISYSTDISDTAASYVNGGGALSVSLFFSLAQGRDSYTGTVVHSHTFGSPYFASASSSVSVSSAASGPNATTVASVSSFVSTSSGTSSGPKYPFGW